MSLSPVSDNEEAASGRFLRRVWAKTRQRTDPKLVIDGQAVPLARVGRFLRRLAKTEQRARVVLQAGSSAATPLPVRSLVVSPFGVLAIDGGGHTDVTVRALWKTSVLTIGSQTRILEPGKTPAPGVRGTSPPGSPLTFSGTSLCWTALTPAESPLFSRGMLERLTGDRWRQGLRVLVNKASGNLYHTVCQELSSGRFECQTCGSLFPTLAAWQRHYPAASRPRLSGTWYRLLFWERELVGEPLHTGVPAEGPMMCPRVYAAIKAGGTPAFTAQLTDALKRPPRPRPPAHKYYEVPSSWLRFSGTTVPPPPRDPPPPREPFRKRQLYF